ncbi:phage holin family protein [Aeromicrobium sp. CF4.19]|uniref:phage holin family protein n=1 Tax=Aeromicrobium sp. CF4.19 TaxID=3373082 RepID=UPI003EE7F4FF
MSAGDEPSTGELITRASDDISAVVRAEIALAKNDLQQSGKRLGLGAGLFGVAGILSLYGVGALLAAAILALAGPLAPWLAALIVAGSLFLVSGIAALVGKTNVSHVADAPKERVESVQEDIAVAKGKDKDA